MRILIADGHPTVRLGLKGLLLATEVRVVGEAEKGEEAVRLAEELGPDLVVLGLNLTGKVDGVEACRRIKALPTAPYVLVHAAHELSGHVSTSLLEGADGYLHKRARCQDLLDAIRRTAASERVWSPGGEAGGASRSGPRFVPTGADAPLTPKEREVLALMLRRYTNAKAAQKLHLSLPTVKTHVRSILRKTGAKNRKELFRDHESPEAL